MGLTNFPHGITSFGIPILGNGNLIPSGTLFFVDGTYGNDGNSGTDPDNAVQTINRAISYCTNDVGDTIYVLPGTYAELVVVNKSKVRLWGFNNCIGGPWISRINPAGATSATATITVQARDVEIAGLCVAGNHDAGYNTDAVFFDGENGGTRGYIHDCTIEQLTPTATAYSNGIKLIGDRHTVERCVIDSCQYGIYITTGATATTYETIIRDCIIRACNRGIWIQAETVATGQAASVIHRCLINAQGAYAQAYGIIAVAAYAGIIADCRITGYTDAIATATTLSQNYDGVTGGVLITS